MKFNPFRQIFFLSSIILLSSCLGTTNTPTATSSNPDFVSLKFTANDSIPYLSTAVFTLVGKTIINVDSLPYKTRVDSVFPVFTFVSTAGTILHFPKINYKYKKDSALITGKDTIDFRQPISLRNYASDAKTYKDYVVEVNVHQVDPELYLWKKLSDNLNDVNATNQKAIILNNKIFFYQNDGSTNFLKTSTDGISWINATVTGLPVNAPLRAMVEYNGKLYLTQDGDKIYTSTDGSTWNINNFTLANYTFKSIIFGLNDSIRAVTQSKADQLYRFASSKDGITWIIKSNNVLPVNFPVSDFASVTFNSSTGKAKGLLLEGSTLTNAAFHTNWTTEDGNYWVNLSTENHTLDTLAVGASVISYDSKLFVLGTRNDKSGVYYRVSKDEGLSWQKPDTLRNFLPKDFIPRSFTSTVVLKPSSLKGVQPQGSLQDILQSNHIFIIGGKTGSAVLSDEWTGKLNRKSFLRQ